MPKCDHTGVAFYSPATLGDLIADKTGCKELILLQLRNIYFFKTYVQHTCTSVFQSLYVQGNLKILNKMYV